MSAPPGVLLKAHGFDRFLNQPAAQRCGPPLLTQPILSQRSMVADLLMSVAKRYRP